MVSLSKCKKKRNLQWMSNIFGIVPKKVPIAPTWVYAIFSGTKEYLSLMIYIVIASVNVAKKKKINNIVGNIKILTFPLTYLIDLNNMYVI